MGQHIRNPKRTSSTLKIEKLQHLFVIKDKVPYAGERILAFDQGLSITGFGFMTRNGIEESGIIKMRPKDSAHVRYDRLFETVNHMIDEYEPDLVLYETGGGYGGAGTWEAKRGMILSEFCVSHACYARGQRAMMIQNEAMKYQVADKQRLADLKKQRLRSSMRPIKEDVHDAIEKMFKLKGDWMLSSDHGDVLGLLVAYATNPAVAKT